MKNFETMGIALDNLSTKGAFLTTTNGQVTNTMTITWGFIGFAWRKPIFVAMVRPQRYTREILEEAESFTISIPYNDDFKKALALCGSKSGRDVDKTELACIEFIEAKTVKTPVVKDCNGFFECTIIHKEELTPEFMPKEYQDLFYKAGDCHEFIFGEIVDSY